MSLVKCENVVRKLMQGREIGEKNIDWEVEKT